MSKASVTDMPATTKTGMNWQQRLADLYETNAMKIIHKKKIQYISSRSRHVCVLQSSVSGIKQYHYVLTVAGMEKGLLPHIHRVNCTFELKINNFYSYWNDERIIAKQLDQRYILVRKANVKIEQIQR